MIGLDFSNQSGAATSGKPANFEGIIAPADWVSWSDHFGSQESNKSEDLEDFRTKPQNISGKKSSHVGRSDQNTHWWTSLLLIRGQYFFVKVVVHLLAS